MSEEGEFGVMQGGHGVNNETEAKVTHYNTEGSAMQEAENCEWEAYLDLSQGVFLKDLEEREEQREGEEEEQVKGKAKVSRTMELREVRVVED